MNNATIKLGHHLLDIEKIEDGTYKLNPEQVVDIIGTQKRDLINYLEKFEGSESTVTAIDSEETISHLPLTIAVGYWLHEAMKHKNIKAQALAIVSMKECVMRRADQFLYEP